MELSSKHAYPVNTENFAVGERKVQCFHIDTFTSDLAS